MLSKYQFCGQSFWHGTHRLGLVCTNVSFIIYFKH
jgi:hypothetical protein